MMPVRRVACAVALASAVLGCGRKVPSGSADGAVSMASNDGASTPLDGAVNPEDPRATDLWARAREGDLDELERLHAYVGSDGLIEESSSPARRVTAVRALAFDDDFHALPFLATLAASGADDEASAALESVVTLANEPRRAVDPEDALELHEGSAQLLALAKDATRPARRRGLAVVALRLFADRGWVPRADVPTDLDAR